MRRVITQIFYLALADLQQRYINTKLGLLWAIIQPALTFSVFWFVSVVGLRMKAGEDGVPFFAVLFCGLLPWMTLSTAITSASGCLRGQRHLLVDRAARASVVVSSGVLSAAIMHLPLFIIVAAIFILGGLPISPDWWAIIYYMGCLFVLALCCGLCVAPLAAWSHDLTQAVNALLLLWFWGSPVIWNPSFVPDYVLSYLRLNPFFYVIEGYRGSLLYAESFPAPPLYHFIFWATVIIIFCVGLVILRVTEPKLREWLQRV